MPTDRQIPIACNLDAFNSEERTRYQGLVAAMRAGVQDVRELPDGFALRLVPDTSNGRTAAEFALMERRCCPFLRIALEFDPGDGPLWLRLSGGPGVKEFLATRLRGG